MESPLTGIRLRGSAITNQGRVRHNNEDSVDLWAQENHIMAVVADGMGGAAAGEEASRIAIETVRNNLFADDYPTPEDLDRLDEEALIARLRDVVRRANRGIFERAVANPSYKGMGTTLTLALIRHNEVVVAHVGDSRAYLVDGHDGSIEQLTSDHSFVQALVDAGHITQEEAENHPMHNVLYRALGQGTDIDVDMYQDVRLHIGDRLVLCSDGLTLHVKSQEIADIVMAEDDPASLSQKLVDLALERGGRDNVSVIVIIAEAVGDAVRQPDTVIILPAAEADDPMATESPDEPASPPPAPTASAEQTQPTPPTPASIGEMPTTEIPRPAPPPIGGDVTGEIASIKPQKPADDPSSTLEIPALSSEVPRGPAHDQKTAETNHHPAKKSEDDDATQPGLPDRESPTVEDDTVPHSSSDDAKKN